MKPNSILKIIALLLLAGGLCSSLPAQVVGYWNFNEKAPGNFCDTNAGAILDASGNGHNGTESFPTLPYVVGNPAYGSSSAITFYTNGGNDKIVVPDADVGAFNFGAGQSVTIEAVIRANSGGINGSSISGNIISKQGAVAGAVLPGEWYLRLLNAPGNLRFSANDGTGLKSATGSKSLADGKWHHIAAVYDANAQQLRVYVDYVLDGTATTTYTGTIGNTNDLCLGQQNNNGARFDGDIDFIKFSLGALDPTNFVQASTSIANLSPANGSIFLSPTNMASFSVSSSAGVATTNIVVTVNGSNITSQLVLSGDDNNRTVTLPPLAANILYNVNISVRDNTGFHTSQPWVFNTFVNDDFSFEGEDYNFGGGQYIDNPVLSSADGPDSYLDQLGVEGVDFNQTNAPVLTQYRIGDLAGTAVCPDMLRQAYINARVNDPGVTDYMLRDNADSEWLNYTRTFPAGTYHVYERMANPGTLPAVIRLDEVTSGSTTATQTIAPIGSFRNPPTSSATDYEFVPLTDALGNEAAVSLGGLRTLRLTFVSAGANVLLNYLVFVPVSGMQVPYLASVSPTAGADNAASTASIQASIRNADTKVNSGTVQLQLDGGTVTSAVTPTSLGADVLYTPANLTTGLHTATLIFTDSAATSVTNHWQFFVANQAVLGYWKFNEQTPGNFANTNAGAILDASGNGRNGTVNVSTMSYVDGGFNFGSTPALRFTPGPDHVVVPDPSGVFIFTNSFTFEAVVRSTNNVTTQGAILAKNGTTDGEGEYWWRFPGNATGQQEVAMDGHFLTGTNVLNDGQWHHVAVVYDATNNLVQLYADYVLEATATNVIFGAPIGRPTDLFIGSFINGGSELDADVDSIRISSGALTPDQFIPKAVALQPIVSSLLPTDGANNVAPTALIEAIFQNRDTSVTLNSMKLFIDGNDVTANVVTSSNATTATITYTPATPLASGAHIATVTFQDTATPANSWTNSWSFNTLAMLPIVALYQFNEKSPGDMADTNVSAILDSSGNGHNGSIYLVGDDAINPVYVMGDTNYGDTPALDFTYVPTATNCVIVPDPNLDFNFSPTQSITMEAIIRTSADSQSGQGCILAKQGANPGEWYWRIASTGLQRFSANNGQKLYTVNSLTPLYDGQWHHIAAVYDGASQQLRVYCDYKLDCTAVSTPSWTSPTSLVGNTNEDMWIGAQQSGSSRFDGDIDEIRVTAAALDPSWFIQPGATVTLPQSPQLTGVTASAGLISFNFTANASHSYIVQSTGNLLGAWTNVETITGDGAITNVHFPVAGSQQFFRVIAQ